MASTEKRGGKREEKKKQTSSRHSNAAELSAANLGAHTVRKSGFRERVQDVVIGEEYKWIYRRQSESRSEGSLPKTTGGKGGDLK